MSALGYGGIISLSNYVFFKPFVFTLKSLPHLWRPLTAFLITKPKFGILMDPYFCYQYGSGLERESARFSQPGDFAVYTAFCAGFIAVSISYRQFAKKQHVMFVASTRVCDCNQIHPRNICPRSLLL